jgi:hypothetical protein
MHNDQPRQNRRHVDALNFRWRSEDGIDMIALPKTRAGTYYIPDEVGVAWCALEHEAITAEEVFRCIDLLSRNRKARIWLAASRSAFNFRLMVEPLPDVMEYFLRLHTLRKSV